MPLTNNSIVAMTDIRTGAAALVCTTDSLSCCTSANRYTANWYFPNGSWVSNNPALPYQRTRATNPGRVILNRNSESPTTGIFFCTIPVATGELQILYIGIYTCATGEFCPLHEWTGVCIVLLLEVTFGLHVRICIAGVFTLQSSPCNQIHGCNCTHPLTKFQQSCFS